MLRTESSRAISEVDRDVVRTEVRDGDVWGSVPVEIRDGARGGTASRLQIRGRSKRAIPRAQHHDEPTALGHLDDNVEHAVPVQVRGLDLDGAVSETGREGSERVRSAGRWEGPGDGGYRVRLRVGELVVRRPDRDGGPPRAQCPRG